MTFHRLLNMDALKHEKFCEKMSDYVLFKNIDDKFLTFRRMLRRK